MIRYNWERISQLCNWDAKTIVEFLRSCTGGRGAINNKLKRISKQGVPYGSSYIINLEELLQDRIASAYDIVQYIELCSRRNYADYKFHKAASLPDFVAHDTNIQYNRLLTVKNRQIYFKYETEETDNGFKF